MKYRSDLKISSQKEFPAFLSICSLLLILLLLATYCVRESPEREVRSVTDEEAEGFANQTLQEVSAEVIDGLNVTLWANENLMSDAVSLYMDHRGRAYVTITERRRNSELDIRGHSNWMTQSLLLETTEERVDFVKKELASERSEQNSWLTDYNNDGIRDWRDLMVNQESVVRIEDTTGNGFANRAERLIQNFNDVTTDVAGAVLHRGEDLFVGVSPDMWRIRDGNGDGYYEQKKSISQGFGVNIGFGGHGMSGLTTGPDGRIYWSVGDVGMSVLDNNGKRWHYPRQGVIVRSEPDGSGFEVFAAGLRNTHEFTFDKYGNLITIDNDGDHAGEHERLVYLVNGSDSGWRLNWQFGKYSDPKNNDYKVLMEEGYFKTRFETQAAHLLPPVDRFISGPSGMAYNPGTALDDSWEDHFFVGKFVGSPANSGIHAFSLKPKGASFELLNDRQVLEGILPTSLSFGPDGALYFTDWIEGWTLKQKGRIWKVDSRKGASSKIRMETGEILSQGFSDLLAADLLQFMEHRDMRVRQGAQFELVSRDGLEQLLEAASQKEHQLKRIHGIWGIAQIARENPDAARALTGLLKDTDAEIRAQAAKMLGDVRYEPAADSIIHLLKDESARVRFFATEALGRMAWQPAQDPVIEMLEANNDEDVYLRHGGAIALGRIGDEEALVSLSDHPSKAVRIAAVVALRRMDSPGVIRYLQDEDEFIVTNAARAINDDRLITKGLENLSKLLEQDRFLNEPLIRRAINASLRLGTDVAAKRLTEFASGQTYPENLRTEALSALAVWSEPSVLDRVTGDPRDKIENKPEVARRFVEPQITGWLNSRSVNLRMAALEATEGLKVESAIPDLLSLLRNDASPEVRSAALNTLAALNYEQMEDAAFKALDDDDRNVRMNALQLVSELAMPAENRIGLLSVALENGTRQEKQAAIEMLAGIPHPSVSELLSQYMERLTEGELDRGIELELIVAAEIVNSPKLKNDLVRYGEQKSLRDSGSLYRESLFGGDAGRGRRIFYQNVAAQCIRCHAINGEGSDVGPELGTAGDRLSREELLRSMVDPGADITPGYGSVTLTLKNGETVAGLLRDETTGHITVASNNHEQIIDKSDVSKRRNSTSGMPAMGELLTRSELRDLVEFMTTLKKDTE